MKKLAILFISLIFITACETVKKPNLEKPFSKCPPKDERTLKDILCRE